MHCQNENIEDINDEFLPYNNPKSVENLDPIIPKISFNHTISNIILIDQEEENSLPIKFSTWLSSTSESATKSTDCRRSGSLADINETFRFPFLSNTSSNGTLLKIQETDEELSASQIFPSCSTQPSSTTHKNYLKSRMQEANSSLLSVNGVSFEDEECLYLYPTNNSMTNLKKNKHTYLHSTINSSVSLPPSSPTLMQKDFFNIAEVNKNTCKSVNIKISKEQESLVEIKKFENNKANKYRRKTISEISNQQTDRPDIYFKKRVRKGSLIELTCQKSFPLSNLIISSISTSAIDLTKNNNNLNLKKKNKKKLSTNLKKTLDKNCSSLSSFTLDIEKDEGWQNAKKTLKFWKSRMSFSGLKTFIPPDSGTNKIINPTRRYSMTTTDSRGL